MADGRVERRLSAIFAGDVAGYSRLMGADEEGTLARLNAHRREFLEPNIAEHRGRIVKRTGDGILIEFASAVDAVRCAIQQQRGMAQRNVGVAPDKRIELRVGIHVGDIIIEEGDIFGDGVNIAARLESIAEPGGICISDDAYRQVRSKLDVTFEDGGNQQLKNIDHPVRVYRIQLDTTSKTSAPQSALPEKPSIAVLPFQNMSGDSEQEYFCDGMVEDIITGLSRIKWLFVIARNSSFIYKGHSVDVKQVGRDLGVRYVLEGSVRKGGNRVRVTAQLVEGDTGRHVWAERYDRPLDDIFALQDEITLNVVGAIEPSLRQAEIERVKRERPDNLGAYDLVLRALPDIYVAMPDEADRALQLLDRALALEPDYALAHGYAAWCHEIRFVRAGQRAEDRDAALRHAHAALAHAPDDATALGLAGFVIAQIAHDMRTARKAFEQALAISPSSFIALALGAVAVGFRGDGERAIDWSERAIRLSPFDRLLYVPNQALATGHFLQGQYDRAADAARRAIQSKPEFSVPHLLLAASLGAAGRLPEARASAARALTLQPGFSTRAFCEALAIPPSLAVPFGEALRAAGLPD
jgi:adenylate cyclase